VFARRLTFDCGAFQRARAHLGVTGDPDCIACCDIERRLRPALDTPFAAQHAGECAQVAERFVGRLHDQYTEHLATIRRIQVPRRGGGRLQQLQGFLRCTSREWMHRGAIERTRKAVRSLV
jgi:hypothetical protein